MEKTAENPAHFSEDIRSSIYILDDELQNDSNFQGTQMTRDDQTRDDQTRETRDDQTRDDQTREER